MEGDQEDNVQVAEAQGQDKQDTEAVEPNKPTDEASKEGEQGEDESEHEMLELNRDGECLTEEERVRYVQKFDMFVFESRVQKLIQEALAPFSRIQANQGISIAQNKQTMLQYDKKVLAAQSDLTRAAAEITSYKALAPKIEELANEQQLLKGRLNENMQHLNETLNTNRQNISMCRADVDLLRPEIFTIKRKVGLVDKLQSAFNQFQTSVEDHIDENMTKLRNQISDQKIELTEGMNQIEVQGDRISTLSDLVKSLDARVRAFQMDVQEVQKVCIEMRAFMGVAQRWDGRMSDFQNELGQLRRLNEAHIIEVKDYLGKACLTQRKCEEAILKANFEMMEEAIDTLDDDFMRQIVQKIDELTGFLNGEPGQLGRNLALGEQMKLDFRKWRFKMLKRLEEVNRNEQPWVSMFKDVELPAYGAARREHLEQELDANNRLLAPKPKTNDYGDIRCETVKHPARKTLECGKMVRLADDSEIFVARPMSSLLKRPGSAGRSERASERVFVPFNQMMHEQKVSAIQSRAPTIAMVAPEGGAVGSPLMPSGGPPSPHPVPSLNHHGGGESDKLANMRQKLVVSLKKTRKKVDPERARWGKTSMPRFAQCPQGLSFLETNRLLEREDLPELKKEFEFVVMEKLQEYELINQKSFMAHSHKTLEDIEYAKHQMRGEIQKVIDVDLKELDQLQQQRMAHQQTNIESQIYDVQSNFVEKFLEQNTWNKNSLARERDLKKANIRMRSDLMLEFNKIKAVNEEIKKNMNENNDDLTNVIETLSHVLQLQYVTQALEFQDEVDRHDQSLWATQTFSKDELAQQDLLEKLRQREKETGQGFRVAIDEDCLGCSLEKYRPFIRDAFKLACIQYRPSFVRLNDKEYGRVPLINAKRSMIEDIARRHVVFQQGYKRRILAKSYGPGQALEGAETTHGSLATKDHGIDMGTRDISSRSMTGTPHNRSDDDGGSISHVKRVRIVTSADFDESNPVVERKLPDNFDFQTLCQLELERYIMPSYRSEQQAALSLEIDIHRLILDKQLRNQIIKNSPKAAMAMLYDAADNVDPSSPVKLYPRFRDDLTKKKRKKSLAGWNDEDHATVHEPMKLIGSSSSTQLITKQSRIGSIADMHREASNAKLQAIDAKSRAYLFRGGSKTTAASPGQSTALGSILPAQDQSGFISGIDERTVNLSPQVPRDRQEQRLDRLKKLQAGSEVLGSGNLLPSQHSSYLGFSMQKKKNLTKESTQGLDDATSSFGDAAGSTRQIPKQGEQLVIGDDDNPTTMRNTQSSIVAQSLATSGVGKPFQAGAKGAALTRSRAFVGSRIDDVIEITTSKKQLDVVSSVDKKLKQKKANPSVTSSLLLPLEAELLAQWNDPSSPFQRLGQHKTKSPITSDPRKTHQHHQSTLLPLTNINLNDDFVHNLVRETNASVSGSERFTDQQRHELARARPNNRSMLVEKHNISENLLHRNQNFDNTLKLPDVRAAECSTPNDNGYLPITKTPKVSVQDRNRSTYQTPKAGLSIESRSVKPVVALTPKDIGANFVTNHLQQKLLELNETTKVDARKVKEALGQLTPRKKRELLDKVRASNKQLKQLDNLAVIKGITGEKLKTSIGEVGQVKNLAMAQMSALGSNERLAHHSKIVNGSGYLYSRSLVSNLKHPYEADLRRSQSNVVHRPEIIPEVAIRTRSPIITNAASQMDQNLQLAQSFDEKSRVIRALGASATIQNIESAQKLTGMNSAHVLRGSAVKSVNRKKESLLPTSNSNILEDSKARLNEAEHSRQNRLQQRYASGDAANMVGNPTVLTRNETGTFQSSSDLKSATHGGGGHDISHLKLSNSQRQTRVGGSHTKERTSIASCDTLNKDETL